MDNKDFAVFILTHGRADNVITYKTLRKQGYTGDIYIIIDDEDKQGNRYRELYGDKVVEFSKKDIAKTFDEADNFNDRRAIIYARNAAFEIAKKLNIKYFIQLDDDYTEFDYRLYQYGNPKPVKSLDILFNNLLLFYKKTNIDSIAIAQGGDFIGGKQNDYATDKKLRRKAMNSFICSTDRPFNFVGRINEDVNTYTYKASIGLLMFTTPLVSLTQKITQTNSGGLTDIYLDRGTYVKSFYTILFSPSCCKVAMMGDKNYRLHHKIKWNNAVPKILSEEYKK